MAGKKRASRFKQGIFRPVHPEKYRGKGKPVYRSSYELKLHRWCDHNPKVLRWGSESIVIPYSNPLKQGATSRYFVDYFIEIDLGDKQTKKFLVEVKPYSQTIPPKSPKRLTKAHGMRLAEWARNQAKWTAARAWAARKNMEFVLVTEKELGL